jgi:hypothetical protein
MSGHLEEEANEKGIGRNSDISYTQYIVEQMNETYPYNTSYIFKPLVILDEETYRSAVAWFHCLRTR